MRLNNKNINTEKQFKDNFDFNEVWTKLEIVISDLGEIVFWDNNRKTRLLGFMNERFRNLETKDELADKFANGINTDYMQEEFGIGIATEYGNLLNKLYEEMCKGKQWSRNKINNMYYIVLALHCLAGREITQIDGILQTINLKGDKSSIEGILKKPSIELVNSDKPYIIPCYDFKAGNDFEIVTKKIINISDSKYGSAKVHIVGECDKVIESFELKPKEGVCINTINNQFIQLVPNIGVSNNHLIYRCSSKSFNDTLKRYNFISNTEYLYDGSKLEDLKQFALDDENGFVAIVKDELELYTNNRFDELFYITEKPVWICVQGSQYIVLTSKGNVITNFAPVKKWKNIISIFFKNNTAFGITSDGNVECSRKDLNVFWWKHIISIAAYEDRVVAESTKGELYSAGNMNTAIPGRYYLWSDGYVILKDDGKVMLGNYDGKTEPYCILLNVKEIAVSNSGIAVRDANDEFMFYSFEERETRKIK